MEKSTDVDGWMLEKDSHRLQPQKKERERGTEREGGRERRLSQKFRFLNVMNMSRLKKKLEFGDNAQSSRQINVAATMFRRMLLDFSWHVVLLFSTHGNSYTDLINRLVPLA